MRTFFITGLPRSGTAWLSNFLTHGASFCFHEAARQVGSLQELPALFARTGSPNVGTADCAFPLYYDKALALFPEAHLVLVKRPRAQCALSFDKLMRDMGASPVGARELFDQLEGNCAAMARALAGRYVLTVEFDALWQEDTCRAIWRHCAGDAPLDGLRLSQLQLLRVNTDPRRVQAAMNLETLRGMFNSPRVPLTAPAPSPAIAPLIQEYHAIIKAFCSKTEGAYLWFNQLLGVLLTWDHIEDGDPLCKATANRAFEAAVLQWPFNPFLQANRERLTTAMVSALSAWRYENARPAAAFMDRRHASSKNEDMYTEVPCAMAMIIGGLPLVGRVMPRLRQLAELIAAQNNLKKQGALCTAE